MKIESEQHENGDIVKTDNKGGVKGKYEQNWCNDC